MVAQKEEIKTLFDAGHYLITGELDKAIEAINSKLEKVIRATFHMAFSLHYGPDYMKHLPDSAQTRISEISKKGPIPLKRAVDKNLFYHLSRSEYAHLINKKENWNNIFKNVFHPKSREEVYEALGFNFALDDRKLHRDRIDYFRKRKEQIRQAIVNAEWLLLSLSNIVSLSINPNCFSEEKKENYLEVRVSFIKKERCVDSYPWKIDKNKGADIGRRLMRMNRFLDFSDDNTMITLFNGAVAEILIVVTKLIREKLLYVEKSKKGNMYLQLSPRTQ